MSDERTTEMVRLRDVLDNYQGELARLLEERTRLDERILQLQNKIRHVARMVDVTVDDPIQQLGLTDAIRYVIQHAGKPMTPVDVRDELLKRYCDPEDYQEPPRVGAHRHETLGTCRSDHVRRYQSGMDGRTPHAPHRFYPLQSKLSKELSSIPLWTRAMVVTVFCLLFG